MTNVLAPRMNYDSFIRVYENAYSDEYCQEVIDAFESISRTAEEGDHHDHSNNKLRRDSAVFMDDFNSEGMSKEESKLRERLTNSFAEKLIPEVSRYLKDVGEWDNVSCIPQNMKVQKYEADKRGGYYAFHAEQSYKSLDDMRRLLTYVLYLNDVPEGEGETEFLHQGIRCQPKRGSLVLFPAFFTHTHRGNPVFTTDKYIATGWMLWANVPEDGVEADE